MTTIITKLAFILLLTLLLPPAIQAQTHTKYTYDALGRLTMSASDNGDISTYTYDKVGNITKAIGIANGSNSTNSPPTCTNVAKNVYYDILNITYDGLEGCSDPDGDALILVAVTDPPGPATAVKNNNSIVFGGMLSGSTATTVRTVSDGKGGSIKSRFSVTYFGGGCQFC